MGGDIGWVDGRSIGPSIGQEGRRVVAWPHLGRQTYASFKSTEKTVRGFSLGRGGVNLRAVWSGLEEPGAPYWTALVIRKKFLLYRYPELEETGAVVSCSGQI